MFVGRNRKLYLFAMLAVLLVALVAIVAAGCGSSTTTTTATPETTTTAATVTTTAPAASKQHYGCFYHGHDRCRGQTEDLRCHSLLRGPSGRGKRVQTHSCNTLETRAGSSRSKMDRATTRPLSRDVEADIAQKADAIVLGGVPFNLAGTAYSDAYAAKIPYSSWTVKSPTSRSVRRATTRSTTRPRRLNTSLPAINHTGNVVVVTQTDDYQIDLQSKATLAVLRVP